MKVTNKYGLPAAFVQAVSVERHNKAGCYSATTLNKGAKEVILQERHWDELETDASDNVWAVFGTATHAILEKHNDDNFHEESFRVSVEKSFVTGTVDSYDMDNGIIVDWKTASVYKVLSADFTDWYNQGMTYAWLLRQTGLYVRTCRFVALLKDHSKSKAKNDHTYPQSPIYVYEFDVTEEALTDAEGRIRAKIIELEEFSRVRDDDIRPCSAAERWASPEKYAVMKHGRKSAVRLFDNANKAKEYAERLGSQHYVEHRPEVSRKCQDYCLCNKFCNFYNSRKKEVLSNGQ